jgi:hypothetical protein
MCSWAESKAVLRHVIDVLPSELEVRALVRIFDSLSPYSDLPSVVISSFLMHDTCPSLALGSHDEAHRRLSFTNLVQAPIQTDHVNKHELELLQFFKAIADRYWLFEVRVKRVINPFSSTDLDPVACHATDAGLAVEDALGV